MLFYDGIFLVFIAIVAVLTYAARVPRLRIPLLLIASYIFYGAWDWRFLFLIFGTTLLNWLVSAKMPAASTAERRALLVLGLGANLGALFVFKYLDFGIASLNELLSLKFELIGLTLPVGISFFTFQSMSYTIDVYRNNLEPRKNFIEFALFVSFFPQLVAGPIIRAADFLPQIHPALSRFPNRVVEAAPLFVLGLFKKVAIADNLATIVDPVFASPELHGAADQWLANLSFAGQIYCDFSGYTDMALAICILFGFKFPLNFRSPYLASGPQDFWRRWHISLSTWLRDYLYISLGGSRRGVLRTCTAIMTTMLLGGLWHGAAWTFVLWGFYHGVLLIIERSVRTAVPQVRSIPRLVTAPVFLVFTLIGWMVFRAESWPKLLIGLGNLFEFNAKTTISPTLPLLAFGVIMLEQIAGEALREREIRVNAFVAFATAGVLLLVSVLLRPQTASTFIYFQF